MAHFKSTSPESKKNELLRQMKEARNPDSVDQFMNRIANATDSIWTIKISNEKGRQIGFAVSAGGILLALGAVFFLNLSEKAIVPALLASACAFVLGLRQVRKTGEKQQAASERRLRDIGPQSGAPMARTSSAIKSANNRGRWAA